MGMKREHGCETLSLPLVLTSPHLSPSTEHPPCMGGAGQGRDPTAPTLLPRQHSGQARRRRAVVLRPGWHGARREACKIEGRLHPEFPAHPGVALDFVFPSTAGLGPRFENYCVLGGGEFY